MKNFLNGRRTEELSPHSGDHSRSNEFCNYYQLTNLTKENEINDKNCSAYVNDQSPSDLSLEESNPLIRINQNDLLTSNSLIDSLKESIKSSFRSKKTKEREAGSFRLDQSSEIGQGRPNFIKTKTEKEKLMEYYQNIKNSSKLNISASSLSFAKVSNQSNDLKYKTSYNEKIDETLSAKCAESSITTYDQGKDSHTSGEHDFVIFDCFKSLLSQKKYERDKTIENKVEDQYNDGVNKFNKLVLPTQEHLVTSFVNEMRNFDEHIDNNQIDQNLLNIAIKKCSNSTCLFYKKKYKLLKKSNSEYKRKYLKHKKLTEVLNMKLLYENVKYSQIEKLNSTSTSKNNEEESKFTKLFYEKLQDNTALFEKLENEIINKNLTIRKQTETINHFKHTTNKLLEQFNIFYDQGNYLIGDILILKQNMIDRNYNVVPKEFNLLSLSINDYTNSIKIFSEKAKGFINVEEKDSNYSNNYFEDCLTQLNEKNKNSELNTIEEINPENESILNFSLTKSELKTSQHSEDRCLRFYELNNKDPDDF